MELQFISDRLSRIRSAHHKPSNSKAKLYDPRKGSAYTRLSLTHEAKLRKYIQEENERRRMSGINHRNDTGKYEMQSSDDTASYIETSDVAMHDATSCESHVKFHKRGYTSEKPSQPTLQQSKSCAVFNDAVQDSLQPTISLPINLETQSMPRHVNTDITQKVDTDKKAQHFETRIQVPYRDDNLVALPKPQGRHVGNLEHKGKDPILIESFLDSMLSSFPVSRERCQSFSMLTFNVGLLEVRMFGIQMYQNPGYTERRLRCVPSEIRKANADVVAFQEVYSDSHMQYIVSELRDLYPYYARNDQPPVSEAFKKLNDRSKKYRKRGLGFFHSGLLFLSKFPILCAKFHPWDVVTPLEALLANKGYLEIFVDIPTIGHVVFYNMHMASASINPESTHVENVRNEEVKQLLRTAERACRMGFAPIIIGDLNAAPNNCTSNYMSFLHSGWTDSYVASRQKVRQKRWLGVKAQRTPESPPPILKTTSNGDFISVENVFGNNRSQRPQLDKVTIMSNMPRSKSGDTFKATPTGLHDVSRWSRLIDYISHGKSERLRKCGTTCQSVKAYYPRGNSLSYRVIHCHTLKKHALPKMKKMNRLRKRLLKCKLSIKIRAPCLDEEAKRTGRSFRERCSALFRRYKSRGQIEQAPMSKMSPIATLRSRLQIDSSAVCFVVKNPSMQLKRPQVKRFYWWNRRRNFMDVTWDPKNPLNVNGPHAGCSGLRCDYIFLPPPHIAGILKGFTPSSGEILFREPIIMIDKVGSAYNCLCSAFTSMKKVMLVTLSDHYGLKVTLSRKQVTREELYVNTLRPFRTI
ncbi:putative endonuclease/exonuclease/phosphatase [Babesia divergens]|uniref:Endonuclease/exonuclease/phosphatase n=1 Tax=Babesia divergens TaxID=32595 RepID=A0AAD9GAA4_BABDI|nr:putative endonuclease/exonuclease/phosphatase [Babesia divergens]